MFDLTAINESMQGDEEDVGSLQDSKTAIVGARTARVVRVLRLVRILKLYKAYYEAKQARKRRAMKDQQRPGEEVFWDEFDGGDVTLESLRRESRVGKKLSDLTTRRVIGLVLTMMLVLPLLNIDDAEQLPFSGVFGADVVYKAYAKLDANPNDQQLKEAYETSMLQYLYYHNWYSGNGDCPNDNSDDPICPNVYLSHVFWAGIVYNAKLIPPELLKEKVDLGRMSPATVQKWVSAAMKENLIFDYGSMPLEVQTILGNPWGMDCPASSGEVGRLGLSVLAVETDANSDVVKCPEDLRRVERSKFSPQMLTKADAKQFHIGFYFDKRQFVKWEAIYGLITTHFVCIVLCVASMFFANDADKLVLKPVEAMMQKVDTIRENPLVAMKMADEEFRLEEMAKLVERTAEVDRFQVIKEKLLCSSKGAVVEPMETVILEKTIIRIGSLLALGFGEAGANIIEHNMSGMESAMVTAMVEGTRVDCIIGCMRIRDFSIATEVLRENIMTFVNQIAEIVHGVVDEFHGAANKNNGDMFLLIWRSSDLDDGYGSKLADMSMLAFTRILGAVHRSAVLAHYRGHPGLQQRLGKYCRVNLSCALHYGWAIEGAVGSEFKIDASYLSPNVSITETLELATRIYNVSILLSELVVTTCSPEMAAKCRLIDRVVVTGQKEPMQLYVIDLDFSNLAVEQNCPVHVNFTNRHRFRVRQFLEAEKNLKWNDDVHIVCYFNENPDIAIMRFRYTLEFTHVFNMGYQNYSQGAWANAQRLLMLTRTMLGVEDGPSAALLRYMETPYKFEAPATWAGTRELGQATLS